MVFLTGTQALIRLALMQAARDAAAGVKSQGFISGYRGSPLGMVDQQAWKAAKLLDKAGVKFLPAINEELGATAVLGTQRVEDDPERTADGVFAMWYGKGPGVDRAGDALKHGNAYGSSPHGGVLVVAGDDHGCVSSSMPHQSDVAMQSWHMPVVAPASVAEYLEFGLYGWALSRFSGNWVGLTALSEIVESGSTVDLDLTNARVAAWKSGAEVEAETGFVRPADGLHYRWPDLPSLKIEERLHAKLDAVRAFAKVNPLDRQVVESAQASVGIVTCGKAHFDLLEVFRRLDISLDALAAAGVRLYKVGLSYPLEPTRIAAFAEGLSEILVVEEKGAVVETQMRDQFYNAAPRPAIVGKRDAEGRPLVSEVGELRPSRLIEIVAHWLAARFPQLDRRHLVVDFTVPQLLSNIGDAVKRLPYFCAGCPHNTSTKVPEGSRAQAGIGCHFMASWMDRDTEGLIQMGGEGVDWVSHAMFTKVPHVFQNLGDGTYYHSGYLAIRQAIAAGTNITYKILFNDAVAMTGGQPVDGTISVDGIARQVEAEGATKVVVVSDDIAKYDEIQDRFPDGTEFHERGQLDAVQRRLRELPGVTVLIYEQTCAAEKRRRRKKGELVDPARRLFINERVCEGCGDCSVQSNCVAVVPLETELGRKRKIDQSSCNKDYSCANGFCPSFVGVVGGSLAQAPGCARRPGRGPVRGPGREAAAAGAACLDRSVRPAGHRRRRHRRGHGRRGDRDGGAPRGPCRERARLHGLRAERRLGAFVRAPGQGPVGAEPGADRRAAGRRGAGLRHRRRRFRRRAADGAPRPHPGAGQHPRDPGRRIALQSGCEPQGRGAAREGRVRRRRRAGGDDGRAGAGRGVPRRLDRLQHRGHGLRLAARPGAGGPGGDAAGDRAERRRGREQQGGVLARPARRRRPEGLPRAAARAGPGVAPRRDGRRADRALGPLPRRLPGRGLRRALSPPGRDRPRPRGGGERRRGAACR